MQHVCVWGGGGGTLITEPVQKPTPVGMLCERLWQHNSTPSTWTRRTLWKMNGEVRLIGAMI